jgi:hypothetical protein
MALKVDLVAEGADQFYWDFSMTYGKGKPVNATVTSQIAAAATSYAALVANTAGGAAAGDPTYTVKFSMKGPELPGHAAIEGSAGDLLYSDMVTLQDAGLELLRQLNTHAHNEIKSGQRK